MLIAGLPGAGKTTLLYRLLHSRSVPNSNNAVGFNVEEIRHRGTTLRCWDVYSNEASWDLWQHYGRPASAFVFVVDGSDRHCFDSQLHPRSAVQELQRMLSHTGLADAVLLIVVSKQDIPESMSVEEVVWQLGIDRLNKPRRWHAVSCSATTGIGLPEVLDWLVDNIAET